MNLPETVTVTFSCKGCERVVQREYPIRYEFKTWHGTERVISGRFAVMNDGFHKEYKFTFDGQFSTPCDCGRYMTGRPINGTYNASVACNVKCTGAKGHVCECSCGGANHGASHRVA